MYVIQTTSDEILKICSILKSSKKNAVFDNFSPKAIKAIIYNIFPSKLKIAKVTPIYKSEDRSKVNNYRPISVLPIFSQILEKIMYRRLQDFISKNNLLCTNQFGFREKHSTFMASLNLTDKISCEMGNTTFSMGIFIDLSKPLDMLDHKIIIDKL